MRNILLTLSQNRKAQREFRARRQAYLRDLEDKVRRYEAGQADVNVHLQRQIAQLQSENDHLRIQLAEMSRSQPPTQPQRHTHPPPSQPLQQSQTSSYRPPPLQQLPPRSNSLTGQMPDTTQPPMYYPESELRTMPTSPTYEPGPYSPVSQDSLSSALGSPTLPMQHSGRYAQAPPQAMGREPSRNSGAPATGPSEDPSLRFSSFNLRSSKGPYRPNQSVGPSSGPSSRMSYLDIPDSQRSQIPSSSQGPGGATAGPPASMPSWAQLPSPWYPPEPSQPQHPQQQQQYYPEYERYSRR